MTRRLAARLTALPSRHAEPEGSVPRYRTLLSAGKKRAREFAGRVPANVPREHRRAYGLTLSGYLFTVVAQASLLVVFLAAGEFEIAAVAAAGAVGFGFCVFAHRRGRYREPPYVAMLIVFIDGLLGSYYLGAVSGFQFYMLGAIIYPWLAPFIGPRLKLSLYCTRNPRLCRAVCSGRPP